MLFSEFLIEKIVMDELIHQQIETAIQKWVSWLQSSIDDSYRSNYDMKNMWVRDNEAEICAKLRSLLSHVAQKVVRDNKPQIDDPNYEKHIMTTDVRIDDHRDSKGAVNKNWQKFFTHRPQYVYRNTFYITLTTNEVISFIGGNNYFDDLVSTITHEMTHLVQGLRSSLKQTWTKPFNDKSTDLDRDDVYWMNKVEVEAFAQGTATKILLKSKTFDNPSEYIAHIIQMLKMGMVNLFGKEVVPNQDYETIRAKFKKNSDNQKINRAKQQAWRYYNKKLIEKLMNNQ